MKVVIFCGGQGLRMREASEVAPKPMIQVGNRPILWHVMKYYAHFGFKEFVLCLGYKAEVIKQFFLTYNEALANDFVLSDGGANVHLLKTDIHDWKINFVDTGLRSSIGERLRAVRHLLRDDEMFLANYGDTLTDANLPAMIERTKEAGVSASFLAVHPNYSFHVVDMTESGRVHGLQDVTRSDIWLNGGYFVMRSDFLDDMRPGRGPGRGAVPAPDGRGPAARAAVRRLLVADGHAQGPAVAREPARERPGSVAALEQRAERRRRCPRGGLRLMLPVLIGGGPEAEPKRLLAIGAHPDDIEIGCGGTIMKLIEQGSLSAVCWVVLSGEGERAAEAEASAAALLDGALETRIITRDFADGFFPYDGGEIKGFFETLKRSSRPTSSSRTSARTCTKTTASAAS